MAELPYRPARRQTSTGGNWTLLILVAAVLIVAGAWYWRGSGRPSSEVRIDPVKNFHRLEQIASDMVKKNPNLVKVYLATSDIVPYNKIQLSQFGAFAVDRSKLQQTSGDELILDWSQINGRVPVMLIPAEKGIRESDLAPKGSPAAIEAGIPPGWAAVSLKEEELTGEVSGATYGSRVSLVAQSSASEGQPAKLFVISKEAKVIRPLTQRKTREGGGVSMGSGSVQDTMKALVGRPDAAPTEKTVSEITFAMPPEDLTRLAQISGRTKIRMFLLSGLAGAEQAPFNIGEGLDAPAPVEPKVESTVVEVIRGGKKSIQSFTTIK